MSKCFKTYKVISLITLLVLGSAVSSHALVQPRGSDDTFDLVTWNVHNFPGTGFRTIDTLAILIQDLDVDMIAFQEIADTNSFYTLMNQLPGWDGFFSTDDYGSTYQKTAIIWRTDRANVTYVESLFDGSWYQFPRPPMHVTGSIQFGSHYFDFHMIILHLKAGGTHDDWLRRRSAVIMLKGYLDTTVPTSNDLDWIVLGDWNDILEASQSNNVFWPLLEDSTDYSFLTMPMAGDPYWASFPGLQSLIDHTMITSDALAEYGGGNTITLRLDDEYPHYSYRISDHRPVLSQFGGPTSVAENKVNLPDSPITLNAYPNPFNNNINLSVSARENRNLEIQIYDIMGRKIRSVYSGRYNNNLNISVDASGWNSGIYFIRAFDGEYSESHRITLIK
jgi:hypothetical protein